MAFNSSKLDPVVVVGGGFAGLNTVVALSQYELRPEIVLIDPHPRFVFLPLLFELLSGEIQYWEVAPPYKYLLAERGISFLQESAEKIDINSKEIFTSSGLSLKYSQLVLSTGSVPKDCGIKGFSKYTITFNSLEDVSRLRDLINDIKKSCHSPKSLVIVGAGLTGVELSCKLADLLKDYCEIYLIELGERVLSQGKSFNQEQAESALGKRAVKVHLKTRVLAISSDEIFLESLQGGKQQNFSLPHNGVVWTGGARPCIPKLNPACQLHEGKLPVDECMQVIGFQDVLAIGDIASHTHEPWPSNAQVAIQQGKAAAQVLMDIKAGKPPTAFKFFDFGEMLSLGVGNATITGLGLTISGPLAFQIRRITYLMRMPRFDFAFRLTGAWLLGN
ncbi:NAD(P)/FAD-dependent oxidoreductase [Prochlorococcus sp. MIT 1307]|uniref:NAD(P)/FAD-dependent oxidoreductase n=1 Tax=Prochlorococcus sp. MIT 1307 TaxID=3096219 RepID=UPI002A74D58E|nr:NAD(P)/FAD-dependent oxidoreductase [Prochlorococcus sp. MIT 1307]